MPPLPEDRALRSLLSFLGQAQIELLQAKEHAELFGYSAEVVSQIDLLKRAVRRVLLATRVESGMEEISMTLQLLRSRAGKLRGLALLLKSGARIEAGRESGEVWRICDICHEASAIVFCRSDNDYVCESCLGAHTAPGFCKYLSVSAAREVAQAAMVSGD